METSPTPNVTECPICLCVVTSLNNNCTTPCGHVFCFSCLAKAMSKNTRCPCCRQELIEKNNNEEEDIENSDEDEEEDDEDEDEYDDDDDDVSEFSADPKKFCSLEVIMQRFLQEGCTLTDAIMIATGRYSRENEKYNREYLNNLNERFYTTLEELDDETYETNLMIDEDVNVCTVVVG